METKKILYVDVPFRGLYGGDKNRSEFIYDSLLKNYKTDILLIMNKHYSQEIINLHKVNNIHILESKKSSFYQPNSLYDFDQKQLNHFKKILLNNKYQTIVFRYNSTAILANQAKGILPLSNIIIDVDMLSSRICYDAWNKNKSLRNRYYLIEYFKLFRFERYFFKNDLTVFDQNHKVNLVDKRKIFIKE
jgi:hypothetical protein